MTLILLLLLATPPSRPNPALTPGVADPRVTQAIACSTKWGADRRHVTEAMKRRVALAYGLDRKAIVAYGRGPCCEFDHLVSRENGGADDVKNLWPQPWADAKKKDALENRLHREMCAGERTLAQVQGMLREPENWQGAR